LGNLRSIRLIDLKRLLRTGSNERTTQIAWVETGGRIINILEEGKEDYGEAGKMIFEAYQDYRIEEDEMDGTYSTYGKDDKCMQFVSRKTVRTGLDGRLILHGF
jgi:hypothetical protein